MEELKNLVPHDDKMVSMGLTGADIREVFEQPVPKVETAAPERKVGAMIQVSGLSFSYKRDKPVGTPCANIRVGLNALDLAHTYLVATN